MFRIVVLASTLVVALACQKTASTEAEPEAANPPTAAAEPSEPAAEKPAAMGALPKEVIEKVIDEHKAEIRACYETQLQNNKDLAGDVKLKWIIEASGAVGSTTVTTSTLENADAEKCIVDAIKAWKFPAPEGGGIVEVNYPFQFQAG